MSRILLYHAESDSLFEADEEEWNKNVLSFDYALCEDVTGIKEFEDRWHREAKRVLIYPDGGKSQPFSMQEVEDRLKIKGGHTMARDDSRNAARDRMRETARRRSEESTHAGGGGLSVNLPEGVKFFDNDGKTVEFDFIPYVISDKHNPDVRDGRAQVGDLVDTRKYFVHPSIGADNRPYICLRSVGKACPICEAHAAAKRAGTMAKEDIAALRPKERHLYNVIDVNDKKGTLMVWDISYSNFTKQLEKEQEDNNEYYLYAHPDEGFSVRIRFAEESFNRNKFFAADRLDFNKRKNPLSDADLKAAVDLDAALKVLDYKELEAIFLGVDREDGGEQQARGAEHEGRGRTEDRQTRGSEDEGRDARRAPREERGAEREERGAGRAAAADERQAGRGAGRGAEREDSIHDRDPDKDKAAGRHSVDPEQDCPEGGKFGVDTDKLKGCNKCPEPKWNACFAEKDRLAREARAGGRTR